MNSRPRPPLALQFRLSGGWWQIDLASEAASRRCVARILAHAAQHLDEHARVLLGRRLLAAAARARRGGVVTLAVMAQHPSGAALPVVLTVQQPSVRVAAATPEGSVLDALAQGIRAAGDPDVQTLAHCLGPNGPVLRTHRIVVGGRATERSDEQERAGAGSGVATRQLVAEYFVPIPRTRSFALVTLSTALADIPELMLGYFDSIVAAAQFMAAAPD